MTNKVYKLHAKHQLEALELFRKIVPREADVQKVAEAYYKEGLGVYTHPLTSKNLNYMLEPLPEAWGVFRRLYNLPSLWLVRAYWHKYRKQTETSVGFTAKPPKPKSLNYRLVDLNELLQEGDEIWDKMKWLPLPEGCVNFRNGLNLPVRRAMPGVEV